MDDLSIYDRKGNKRSSGTGLLIPLLLSVAVIAGTIAFIEYGALPVDTEQDGTTTVYVPRSTHGVISRAPVVPVERSEEAVTKPESEVQLVPAVAKVPQVEESTAAQALVEPPVPSRQEPVAETPFVEDIGDGEDVVVFLPDDELQEAPMEEVERLYSTLPEETRSVIVEQLPPVVESPIAPEVKKPVAEKPRPRRVVRTAPSTPADARCLISRRELAGVRSSMVESDLDDDGFKYLKDQEDYYWGQVLEHCK